MTPPPEPSPTSMLRHLGNESHLWDSSAVRLALYFTVACATTFLTQTEAVTSLDEWNPFQWLRVILASLVSGLVAMRAYMDNSLSRNAEEPKPPTP